MKYVEKLFLPPLSNDKTPIQQLVDAVLSRNVFNLLTILPRLNKVFYSFFAFFIKKIF